MCGPAHVAPAPATTRVALLAAAVAVCCAAVPISLDAIGRASRGPIRATAGGTTEVFLSQTDAGVLGAWRSRGLRGRTVVHAGRYLHFVGEEEAQLLSRTLTVPGTGRKLDQLLEARAAPPNYLRVAVALRVARRLFFVSPPKALADRLGSLGLTAAALPLHIDVEATPRTLDGTPPQLEEPVLLDVDASWFDEADGHTLLAALRGSRLKIELATVSLAEDAEDVTPAARDAARGFATELAGALAKAIP
jgi:hypothetical protein